MGKRDSHNEAANGLFGNADRCAGLKLQDARTIADGEDCFPFVADNSLFDFDGTGGVKLDDFGEPFFLILPQCLVGVDIFGHPSRLYIRDEGDLAVQLLVGKQPIAQRRNNRDRKGDR